MRLSNYKDHELIVILRSLLSCEDLLTLRKLDIEASNENAASLIQKGYVKNKNEIFELIQEEYNTMEDLAVGVGKFIKNAGSPSFIIVKGIGVFCVSNYADNIYSEKNTKKPAQEQKHPGRMQNKVVIITGGAQGFGAGIAESFFAQGANIVIADLNEDKGSELASEFNSKNQFNKAYFIKCDVSNPDSVDELVNKTALHFGGIDVMISNAGILRAGGLEEMTASTFDIMTKVNYGGYFNCAKSAARIMKLQSKVNNKHFYDIIQINSKSGLKGSNRNFAYAGGKFGGIGLTQSFALELMPFKIKVNSICPGNFFDGPLWSDPETGLFVQYLNAGKVKGAKTIEDVKRFYETQVPAGRGCETEDVAKAAFYAIDQRYETGQAIPVTGGQIMLN